MPQTVEAFPLGLREVLGRGDPPSRLSFFPELLLPTLDIEKFLLLQTRSVEQLGENATVPGAAAEITVPDGQFWYVFSAHAVTDVLDADQDISFALNVRIGNRTIAYSRERTGSGIVPITNRFCNWFQGAAGSLILRPNDAVLVSIGAMTVGAAGSITASTQVVFARLGG